MSDEYDNRAQQHFRTRAVGQIFIGPMKAVGYDNRVQQLTVQDIEFQNGPDAQKFMERQRRRMTNKSGQMRQRRMKLQSIGSD